MCVTRDYQYMYPRKFFFGTEMYSGFFQYLSETNLGGCYRALLESG